MGQAGAKSRRNNFTALPYQGEKILKVKLAWIYFNLTYMSKFMSLSLIVWLREREHTHGQRKIYRYNVKTIVTPIADKKSLFNRR